MKADPALAPDGWVVNARLAAAVETMLKLELVAPERPELEAVRVYPVPALLIESPEKVATPLTALTVAVPESVPEPGFVPIARVMEAVEDVTVFPWASCTVTTGWVLNAVPEFVELEGCVVKARADAAPGSIVKEELIAVARPELVAESV